MMAAACATSLEAATTFNLQLPIAGNNVRKPSGLQIQIFSEWVDQSGYRPVTIEVASVGRAAADRNLTIRIRPDGWQQTSAGVTASVRLPQGATSQSTTIMLPQSEVIQQMEIETREDGLRVEDLSGRYGVARNASGWNWSEASPTILFIDRDVPLTNASRTYPNLATTGALPDVVEFAPLMIPTGDNSEENLREAWAYRHLKRLQNVPHGNRTVDDDFIIDNVRRLQRVDLKAPGSLPEEWLAYTSVDVTVISLDDLQFLHDNFSVRFAALREHLISGGMGIVTGVMNDDDRDRCGRLLGEVPPLPAGADRSEQADSRPDSRLASSATPVAATSAAATSVAIDWQLPDTATYGSPFASIMGDFILQNINGMGGRVINTPTGPVPFYPDDPDYDAESEEQIDETNVPAAKFQLATIGMGRVCAVAGHQLSDLDSAQWSWLFRSLGLQRLQWFQRHGMSATRQNSGFYDFMIPGVGAAPVKGFLAVITVFMVVIGPLNYWFLARFRRLYLLLVTVPLGAFLVTGGLYGLAIFKDGLGTRARVRSYSELLDTGEAVSWSRQVYYAGVAPSSGLIYPRTAAVLPIDFEPWRPASAERTIEYSRQQQRFVGGYLRSRSHAQNLVINLQHDAPRLDVRRDDANPTPVLRNTLDVPIEYVLVADNGQWFSAASVASGAQVSLQTISVEDARQRMSELLTQHQLIRPQGFAPQGSRGRWSNRFRQHWDAQFPDPAASTSLLERNISGMMDDIQVNQLTAGRHYFAITSQAPSFVPVGISNSRQLDGFHLVRGQWRPEVRK